jgi:hypothetical protein
MHPMNSSVKETIIARILDRCAQLKAENVVRVVVRKQGLFLTEPVHPALHIVVGDEDVIAQDNRGYTLKFPVAFQFIFSEQKDPYGVGDRFEAEIQSLIEGDEQLTSEAGTGLASKITYEGATPVVSEETKPLCLTIVMYQVEYRRFRARPDRSY